MSKRYDRLPKEVTDFISHLGDDDDDTGFHQLMEATFRKFKRTWECSEDACEEVLFTVQQVFGKKAMRRLK